MNIKLLALFLCFFLVGCGQGGSSGANTESGQELVEKFGQALLQGDIAGAESMLTSDCRSSAKLQESFDEFSTEFGTPETADTDEGSLPLSKEEAQDMGFPSKYSVDQMKHWGVIEMRNQGRGFDVWVLVVEDAGDQKIAYVDFGYPD